MRALIFDQSALVALGRGTRPLSSLVVEARDLPTATKLYAPALCLAAAESIKAGITHHVAGLPFEIVDLGFEDARRVGAAVAAGVDWRLAHALVAGQPSLDWPDGRIVLTAQPDAYRSWNVTSAGWDG